MRGRIVLREGDLAEETAEALVNPVDTALGFAGGVARALRGRAGPELEQEAASRTPLRVGEGLVTGAGALPARWVIHVATLEPGGQATSEGVRLAMRRALALAAERGARSLAVPALGAGQGSLSLQRCAEILLDEARRQLAGETSLEEIRFVLHGEPAYRVFESVQDARRVAEQMRRLRR